MSIIFDKNLGILEKTIEEIQMKKTYTENKYGINIKDIQFTTYKLSKFKH